MRWSNFQKLVEKEQSNLPSTGWLFGSNIYIMSIISHRQYNFESLKQYYFGKPYVGVSKVTPKTVVTLDKVQNRKYFRM